MTSPQQFVNMVVVIDKATNEPMAFTDINENNVN
jgi:hypothetical protein